MATSSTVILRRLLTRAKFRHLEVLIRVSELGSMRKATTALGMTQPSISQVIAELEELTETRLFFRHARGVEPTEITRDLLPIARRILGALGEGAETIAGGLARKEGLVRVAASEAGMLGLVHPILPDVARSARAIQVILSQSSGPDPLQQIADDTCDILCIRSPGVIPEGWHFVACREDALITVCRPGHPLAGRDDITPAELGGFRWLMNRIDSIARIRFEEAFAEHGWSNATRCDIIVHVPEMTVQLLGSEDFLALIPRSVALPYLDTGQIVALDCAMRFDLAPLGFLWKGEQASQATAHLAKFLTAG